MGTDLYIYQDRINGTNKYGYNDYIRSHIFTVDGGEQVIDYFNWNVITDGLQNNATYEVSGKNFYDCLAQMKEELADMDTSDSVKSQLKNDIKELEDFIKTCEVPNDEEEYYNISACW